MIVIITNPYPRHRSPSFRQPTTAASPPLRSRTFAHRRHARGGPGDGFQGLAQVCYQDGAALRRQPGDQARRHNGGTNMAIENWWDDEAREMNETAEWLRQQGYVVPVHAGDPPAL